MTVTGGNVKKSESFADVIYGSPLTSITELHSTHIKYLDEGEERLELWRVSPGAALDVEEHGHAGDLAPDSIKNCWLEFWLEDHMDSILIL